LVELIEQGLRIGVEQLGVAAHHPAHERRSGQLVESSASSASIWRTPYLSRCATSAIDSLRSARS